MSYKTKSEKRAYRAGLFKGLKSKLNNKKSSYKNKKMRAKKDRYRVDTYVEDGVYNNRYIVHSFYPTISKARMGAAKIEKAERDSFDNILVSADSAIIKNSKRYKVKKKK